MNRSNLLRQIAVACAVGFAAATVHAQWPEKTIKIIAPFPAGNSSDVVARMIGEKLGARLGQTVIVENVVGAAGTMGTAHGAKQPADGYTLTLGAPGPLSVAQWTQAKPLSYDPVKDFVAVASLVYAPQVFIVRNDLPVKNFKEFAAYAKSRSTPLQYGTSGVGTTTHLVMAQIFREVGLKAEHIPYRGGAQTITDLRGGHIDVMSNTVPVVKPLVADNSVKALGTTSPTRLTSLPNVPTLKEQGAQNIDLDAYMLLLAPAKTPDAVVKRLKAEMLVIGKDPDLRKRYLELGLVPMDLPADKLDGFIQSEAQKWKALVDAAGIAKTIE